MNQVVQQYHYRSAEDAVCQLSEVDPTYENGIGRIVFGVFFNPRSDASCDRRDDEVARFLAESGSELVNLQSEDYDPYYTLESEV